MKHFKANIKHAFRPLSEAFSLSGKLVPLANFQDSFGPKFTEQRVDRVGESAKVRVGTRPKTEHGKSVLVTKVYLEI